MFWSGYPSLFEESQYVHDINPMIFRFDQKKLFVLLTFRENVPKKGKDKREENHKKVRKS